MLRRELLVIAAVMDIMVLKDILAPPAAAAGVIQQGATEVTVEMVAEVEVDLEVVARELQD